MALTVELAAMLMGFTLACALSAGAKAVKQTCLSWQRAGRVNAYIIMVWLEWASCVAVAVVSYIYLHMKIPSR